MDINVFQPSLGDDELEAVRRVVESNWIGKGKETNLFESAFAKLQRVSSSQIRSVSSCTEGLFQAIAVLGIGKGDEVILPTISFVGAGNAIAASGARPVFCDVDPRTLNVTAKDIERCITSKTRAILLLHYGGVPCGMDSICELATQYQLAVIEDSSCSIASTYKGKACGTIGEIGTWSFDAMKILVCGDGGMVYCRSEENAVRLEKLLYLGLESESGLSNKMDSKWWEFEISSFSRRSVMNDISSAIGLVQLGRLKAFIARRREIHNYYESALKEIEWLQTPPEIHAEVETSYYLYWIQVDSEKRDALACELRKAGIYTTFRYYPLHLVRKYESEAKLPNAESASSRTLCLPIHQQLTNQDVDKVIDKIIDFGS